MSITNTLTASIVSSFFEIVITHPLDLYKTNKQINNNFKFKNFINLKFKDVYSGFKPRILGSITTRSTFLFSQEYLESKLIAYSTYEKYLGVIIGGSFAQTIFDTPIENLKINSMLNKKLSYNITNFYCGFIPHFIRNSIFFANVYIAKSYGKTNYEKALYGGFGGFIGCYLSHPFDTIKTLRQSKKNIKLSHCNLNDKIKMLWKGANIRALMGLINISISLFIFENLITKN